MFKCQQCGKPLNPEKCRQATLLGVIYFFCPTKYAALTGDCLNEYLKRFTQGMRR